MAYSPTMCQLYVGEAIASLRQKFSAVGCIHYMDDILLAAKHEQILDQAYIDLVKLLEKKKIFVAPEKVQKKQMVDYLGASGSEKRIVTQKVDLQKDNLRTLNGFQRLLGDIKWNGCYLKLPNYEIKPLNDILVGNSALDSPHMLTKEARQALQKIEQILQDEFLKCLDDNQPITLCLFPNFLQPMGLLWRGGPVLWIYLRMSAAKSIEQYPTAVAVSLDWCSTMLTIYWAFPQDIYSAVYYSSSDSPLWHC